MSIYSENVFVGRLQENFDARLDIGLPLKKGCFNTWCRKLKSANDLSLARIC